MVSSEEELSFSSSDCSSDEETDEILQTALECMKKSLSVNAPSTGTEIESRTSEFIQATHQRIYDTFDSDDENDIDTPNEGAYCSDIIERESDDKELLLNSFILDKSGSDNKPKHSVEVFTIDLSGLEADDKEKKTESSLQESTEKPKQLRSVMICVVMQVQ